MKTLHRSNVVLLSRQEKIETQIRKQLDKGVTDEYNRHKKINQKYEHNDSLT